MTDQHFHRRNLPHLYYCDGIYFITYRLHDSIPLHLTKELHTEYEEARKNPAKLDQSRKALFNKYDELLDKHILTCSYLTIPEIAKINVSTLHFPDGKDYKLICFCIMPNHIHLVFKLLENSRSISKIMQSIKRVSARESNKILQREGTFWLNESFDRIVRDDRELFFTIEYVVNNPIKAGLCEKPEDWKYTYLHPDYK